MIACGLSRLVIVVLLSALWPSISVAAEILQHDQCSLSTTGGKPCPNILAYQSGNYSDPITPTLDSGASDPGGSYTGYVDAWDICRYISNKTLPGPSGTSIFVPWKTQPEWQDFTNVAEPSKKLPVSNIVFAEHCSRPASFPIYPDTDCTTTAPQPYEVANFPYEPYDQTTGQGASQSVTLAFACAGGWTQTATVSSTGLDSDKLASNGFSPTSPSWALPSVTYTHEDGSTGSGHVGRICGTDSSGCNVPIPPDGCWNSICPNCVPICYY
jgi:hypothetical protein